MEEQDSLSNYLSRLEILDLPEQNTSLVLSDFSISKRKDNIFLVIGNEKYYHDGANMGRLMAGLVKFQEKEIDGKIYLQRELIIPFSSKLLLAVFKENDSIDLIYMENNHRLVKNIKINNGKVNLKDCEFLFTEENINKAFLNHGYLIEIPEVNRKR